MLDLLEAIHTADDEGARDTAVIARNLFFITYAMSRCLICVCTNPTRQRLAKAIHPMGPILISVLVMMEAPQLGQLQLIGVLPTWTCGR